MERGGKWSLCHGFLFGLALTDLIAGTRPWAVFRRFFHVAKPIESPRQAILLTF